METHAAKALISCRRVDFSEIHLKNSTIDILINDRDEAFPDQA